MEMIRLENVCFAYEGNIALNRVSMTADAGETIALMGPNGCGKSTLLNLLNGLIFPEEGHYFVCGEEITEKALRDGRFSKRFHQRLGYVFQNAEAQLFCASVWDEVAFGPSQMGLSDEEVKRRTEDTLELVGIRALSERVPYHLSGGEKRKAAIACILSMNPEALILDEPMAGLDRKSREWLISFLLQLKKTGKTMILSTHDEEFAARVADRVVEMNEDHGIA